MRNRCSASEDESGIKLSSESRIMLSITTVLSVSAAVSVERLRPGQPKTEAMSTARAKINLRVTAELPS